MSQRESENEAGDTKVVVSAPTVGGIATAINARIESDGEKAEGDEESDDGYPAQLVPVFEVHEDAIEGLEYATNEVDSRGKQRKKIQEYAGRDGMEGWEFGRHLKVLEVHGIAERDGNRWRLAD